MRTSGNIFVKICLKAIRDTFSNIWSAVRVGAAGLNFLVVISNKSGIFKILALRGEPPHPRSLPQWESWCPHKWNQKENVLGLFTLMILKIVSESIFFQSKKFIACRFKDVKEVAKSLMAFNLVKIIRLFQALKDLVKFKLQPLRIFNWFQ